MTNLFMLEKLQESNSNFLDLISSRACAIEEGSKNDTKMTFVVYADPKEEHKFLLEN